MRYWDEDRPDWDAEDLRLSSGIRGEARQSGLWSRR